MSQEPTNPSNARNYRCFELRDWSQLKEGMVVSARVSLPHDQDEKESFPHQIRQDVLRDSVRDAIMLPKARPVVVVKIVRSIGNSTAQDRAICWPVTSLWKTMKKEDFDESCVSNGRPPQAYYPIGNVEPSGDWPYPPIMPEAPNKLSGFVDLWTPIAITWNNIKGWGKGSTKITSTSLQLLRDAAPDFYHHPHLSFSNPSVNSSDGPPTPNPVVIHGTTLSFAAYNAAQEIAEAMDLVRDLRRRIMGHSVTGHGMISNLGGVIDVLTRLQQKAPTITVPGTPTTNSTAPQPRPLRRRAYCNDTPAYQPHSPRGGGRGGGGPGSGNRNQNLLQVTPNQYGNGRDRRSNTVSNGSIAGNQCTWNPDYTFDFGDGHCTSHLDLYDSQEYDACSYASGWWCQDEWASEPEPESSPALHPINAPAGFVPDEVPEIPEWVMDTKDTADDYSPAERAQYWKNEFRTVSVAAVWISRLMARTRRNSVANKAAYTDAEAERNIEGESGGNPTAEEGARDLPPNTESEEQRDEDGSAAGSQASGSPGEAMEPGDNEAVFPSPTPEWAEQADSTVIVAESEEQHSPSVTESQSVSDVSSEELEESSSASSTTANMPNLDAARLFGVDSEWDDPCSPISTHGWSTQVASSAPTIADVLEEPLLHTTAEARFEDNSLVEDDIDDSPSNASSFEPPESLLEVKDGSTTTIRALPDPCNPDVAEVYKQNLFPRFTSCSLSNLARFLTSPPPESPVLEPPAQSLTLQNLTGSAHLPFNEKTEPTYKTCGCNRRHEPTYTRFRASTRSEVLMVRIGRRAKRTFKCISEPAWEVTGAFGFPGVKFGVTTVWDRSGVVELL